MNRYFLFFIISLGYLVFSLLPKPEVQEEKITGQVCSKSRQFAANSIEETKLDKESPHKKGNGLEAKWDLTDEELRAKWKVQDHHQIEKLDFESPLGVERVYRFSQNGVPIVGMEVRIRKEADGTIWEKDNSYQPISELKINQSQLSERAVQVPQELKRYKVASIDQESTVIFVRKNTGEGELAFSVSGQDKMFSNRPTQLLLRVEDGKVLQRTVGRADFSL